MLKKRKITKVMEKLERRYEELPEYKKIERTRLMKRYSSLKRRLEK